MPTTVQIDGVGEVEFPDSMTPDQITQTIKTKILAPKTETKTAQPESKRGFLETLAAGMSPLGVPPTPEVGKGLAEEVQKPVKELPKPTWQEFKSVTGLSDNASQNLAAFVNNISTPTVEFMESPAGMMTAGLGAVPGAASVVGGMFTAKALTSAPETWRKVGELWEKAHSPNATPDDKMALKNAIAQAGMEGLVATAGSIPGARDLSGKLTPKAVQLANALKSEVAKAEFPEPKLPEAKVETGEAKIPPEVVSTMQQARAREGALDEAQSQDIQAQQARQEQAKASKEIQVPETPPEPEREYSSVVEEVRQRGLDTKRKVQAVFPQLSREEAGDLVKRAFPEGKPPETKPIESPPSQPPPQTKTSTPVVVPVKTEQRTPAESPLTPKDLVETTKELDKEFGQEGNVPRGTSEGLSVGPGAASPAEMTRPPIAEAHIGNPDVPPPARASVPWHQAITDVFTKVGTTLKAMAGETMPRTTAANREVGEAGARFLSSAYAARPLAHDFTEHLFNGTGIEGADRVRYMAAIVEDNLRDVRQGFQAKATEELGKGNIEASEKLFEDAAKVRSLIGAKKSPFKTEDEFQDFLGDPSVKSAIRNHIALWNEKIEPMYKEARLIDPDVELPSRGIQTGARVNLKAIQPGDEGVVNGITVPESGKLTGTMRKKTPFGIRAKGTGTTYEIDPESVFANTYVKQLELANKNAFDKALVESGNAVIEKPGWKGTIGDEPVVSYPLTRGPFQGKNIYVRKSLSGEYETASNVYRRVSLGKLTPILNTMNSVALKSLTEFSVHTGNLMTALFNSPISSKLWLDQVLSAPGLHLPYRGLQVVHKLWESFKDAGAKNQTQLAELAKIGALRPSGGSGLGGRMIHTLDTTVRLLLDDTYKGLAEKGILPNTETARREFVNQVGQYNKRAQGPVVRALRESGVGPFATAGRAFTTMGVRMATLTPAVRGATPLGQAMLRASILSKWIGGLSILATINAITTGKVGGRTGTPIGYIDTGLNGKDGKPQIFPFFDLIGLGRALRVAGIAGAVNTQRLGLTIGDSANAAARDILNSLAGVAAGPGTRAISVAATGRAPAMQVNRVSPVVQPGKNQITRNIREAAEDLNPLVKSALTIARGKPVSEALSQQLPRFTLRSGKPSDLTDRYPQIVRLAQTYAFADNLVGRARQEPKDKRWDFVYKEMEGMPMDEQKIVLDQLRRRKVFQ